MSMRTATARWTKKKGKRGVSPIIATILLVAITVVLAAVLYILISGLTKGPGNTPIGTSLTFSSPAEQTAGANNYYNTTVQVAPSGMIASNMIFQVQTSGGSPVVLAAGATITVSGPTGLCSEAVYTFSTGAWTSPAANKCTGQTGSTAPITQGENFALATTTTLTNLGDTMIVVGQGSYSGTLSVPIP